VLEQVGQPSVAWSAGVLVGVGYLSVVITALGYLLWNWALARLSLRGPPSS
jgi:drug/metabolite transporter (DMT)-like permease